MHKKKIQAIETQLAANNIFGQFRFFKKDNGEIWFVGVDVAKILGYKSSRDAIAKHVDEEDKNTVAIHDGITGNPNKIIINESGLYSLIFGSQLPEAKKFTCWVTSEVLPSIRKTGSYSVEKKEVKEISTNDVIKAVFEKYPDAEAEITGISFSEDENGNVITHYHIGYKLPDGTFV